MELEFVDTAAPIGEQAEQMARACVTSGFFRIPLETIDRAVADAAWDSAATFFALDEDEKRRVEFPEPGYPYGYSPYKYETLAKSLDDGSPSGPDLKESLSAGPDCSGVQVGAADQSWIRSPSIWPERPTELKSSWIAYYRALSIAASDLMAVMAVALDLEPNHFDRYIDQPITSMRAIHYPARDGIVDAAPPASPEVEISSLRAGAHKYSLRAGAHSDYGTLTILRTDNVPGLQIRGDDGSWRDAAYVPDTFVVNLGDSIQQWTNDRWRSTMHRVAVTDDRPRQSFAFFHMANWDARIECLPSCLDAGEKPRHEPVEAGPWLMRKFQSTVT